MSPGQHREISVNTPEGMNACVCVGGVLSEEAWHNIPEWYRADLRENNRSRQRQQSPFGSSSSARGGASDRWTQSWWSPPAPSVAIKAGKPSVSRSGIAWACTHDTSWGPHPNERGGGKLSRHLPRQERIHTSMVKCTWSLDDCVWFLKSTPYPCSPFPEWSRMTSGVNVNKPHAE